MRNVAPDKLQRLQFVSQYVRKTQFEEVATRFYVQERSSLNNVVFLFNVVDN